MKKPIFALTISLALFSSSAVADDEAAPAEAKPKKSSFEAADKDGDGKLSEAEFTAMMLAEFDRMDQNETGDLTGEELGDRPSPVVVAMDTNKDAKITRAEFTTAVANLFKDLDTNEDKGLTKGELAVLEAMTKGSGSRKATPPPATGN